MRLHQARRPRVEAERATRQPHRVFKALGVTCVSGFKKRFRAEKLPCPYPDMTPLIMEKVLLLSSARRSEAASPRAPRTNPSSGFESPARVCPTA